MIRTRSNDEQWRTPSKKAPLRAPQPEVSTPVMPAPHLSAPQPNEATISKPLCAPQPFSNGPGADIDGTERRFKRKTRVTTNHRRISKSNSSKSHKRSSRRGHRERKLSVTSRTSRTSFGSGNTMEPEDDTGAQPLQGNAFRKTSFDTTVPYAVVTVVGSNSTAQTSETSFSPVSSNGPLHCSSNSTRTITKQRSYPRKFPPHSWASKTSHTGEIVSSSRPRISYTTTTTSTEDGNLRQGRISSSSARSGTITPRVSASSVSMDSRDVSVVADVVDEAQLEAEFAEQRVKMVEAVQIRPSVAGDEENPQTSDTHRRITTLDDDNNNNNNNNNNHPECAPEIDRTSGEEGEKTSTPTSRDMVRERQRKKTIRGIVALTSFVLVIIILVVVLVVLLRAPRSDWR